MILIAFILRLFFVYFQYSGDIGNHLVWADSFLNDGPVGFFARTFVGYNTANYPPLMIYLFALTRILYEVTFSTSIWLNQTIAVFPSFLIPLLETQNAQAAFTKLPAIIADLGIGLLILKLTRSRFLTALFLFNPAVIYISTVWGQVESIPIFFLLLSIYLHQTKNQKFYLLSHLAFTLAILSKQTALWLLPVYLVLWYRSGWQKLVTGTLVQIIAFVLLYLPFTGLSLQGFNLYLDTLSGSSDLVADAAWNFWSYLVPAQSSDAILLGPLSLRVWSLLALIISYLFVCIRFYQRKLDLYSALFWLSMAAFFLQTRVHERHLFPALVFALLLPIKPLPKLLVYFLLSLYHMLNLYASLNLPFI